MSKFLEMHKESIDVLGFWTEEYREVVISHMMKMYKEKAIEGWYISDVVLNGDNVLLKWNKKLIY